MDHLTIIAKNSIKIEELSPWDVFSVNENSNNGFIHPSQSPPTFACNKEINSKIYLWNGDISRLAVQALILPVYEVLSKSSKLGYQIQAIAGPRLYPDAHPLTELRTSEVRVLQGYDLPARHIIHAVEPKYNPKYKSAAENSLHICYRASLQIAAEKNFSTVAISPLHISRKGFPILDGTHTALRTVRKCLENLPSKFSAVVIVTDSATAEAYSMLFPAYFPRSMIEAEKESKNLPSDFKFNEWGTPVQPERAIRIADVTNGQNNDKEINAEQEPSTTDDVVLAIDKNVSQHSFASMSGDHDKKRKFMIQNMNNDKHKLDGTQERIYQRLLRIARKEDFATLSALKAVHLSGRDVNGNRVVVIVGRHMPLPELNLEKTLLYLILTLDPIVNEMYTIVYFHTKTTVYNHPSTEFLKKLYSTFDHRFRLNLARFCMVHTNAWTKVLTWFFTSFHASDIKNRIVNIRSIPQLYQIVPPDQIDVPPFVLSYDMETNPDAYKTSPQRSPISKRNSALFNHEVSGAL